MTKPGAEIYIPDGLSAGEAQARVTHLGVGAHQDDLEFMALHGIADCYRSDDRWFGGVTVTDGRGSARTGPFADLSDDEMAGVRAEEQREAARVGQYAAMWQLGFASAEIKAAGLGRDELVDDLESILGATQPSVVYTHNPADKHDSHVAVCLALVEAIRRLPAEDRPARVLGCEVWRDLDWVPDAEKVALDVSGNTELARALNAVFASQIAGGKRYDLAVMGRRRANATFFDSHATDTADELWFAIDLTPLVSAGSAGRVEQDVAQLALGYIERFRDDVASRIARLGASA